MDSIVIRKMIDSDVEQLVAIACAAWEPIYELRRQILGDELFYLIHPNWQEEKSSQIRRACQSQDTQVWVAEEDGRPVGFVTFWWGSNQVGVVGNNAVHPSCQGRGIASTLYEKALNEMRAKGMRAARVYTGGDPAHAPARRAYEKAGFDMSLPSVEYFRLL
ncbi:MAG: GNAT family N-acetyltransferase [Firmicutes bacterium]|jgi:predicted N-acetyltransferase YhbS|nr:GNAT family N-acetyltransferase [Bacillota bacterium]